MAEKSTEGHVRTLLDDGWRAGPCYYVSVVDQPKGQTATNRVGLVAGPFATHQEALNLVDRASREAEKVNVWAPFYAFGTVLMWDGSRLGRLNDLLGVVVS